MLKLLILFETVLLLEAKVITSFGLKKPFADKGAVHEKAVLPTNSFKLREVDKKPFEKLTLNDWKLLIDDYLENQSEYNKAGNKKAMKKKFLKKPKFSKGSKKLKKQDIQDEATYYLKTFVLKY